MALQRFELDIPEPILKRLERRARLSQRSLQDELLVLVSEAIPAADAELSADLERLLDDLVLLDDEALRRAASNPLAKDLVRELETLNDKLQREGLTNSEEERHEQVLRQYERVMLIRARSSAILAQRGTSADLHSTS